MTEQTVNKVPQIRFKGFEREWEEEAILSRIRSVIDFRGRTPKKLGMDWSPSGYLALSALNVKDGYIDHYADAHYGDEELYTKWMKGNELHCNQVLFTTEAPMGNVAQIPDTQKYILSQRTIAFVTDAGRLSEDYLAVLLKSPNVFGKLLARSSGGTAKGVSQKSLSSIHVQLSDELTEQNKIGEYFRELDRLIGLQQHKHDKLMSLKKAMLQKMFPQPGATTPEIRFKGFSGSWGEKKLGELIPITSAARVHKHEWTRSGVPFFRTSDVVSLYKGEENDRAFISLDLYKKLSEKIGRIKCGDILITGGGSIGIPFLAKSDAPLYFKDADLLWLKVPESVDSIYLYTFFSSDPFREYLGSISHIGTIGHYTIEQAKKTPIPIPLQAEQQKIGIYFRTLDELISKHAIQLQKLKQVKSACLEKMFV